MDSVIVTAIGEPALRALEEAVQAAQRDDPFARVVVVVDHLDVAAAVRHWLGAKGTINVTAQKGERLAAELARPMLRPLGVGDAPQRSIATRLVESQAVRQVTDQWLESAGLDLSAAGRRRLYAELASAFQQWEQRQPAHGEAAESPATRSAQNLPQLYDDYRRLLEAKGYYTRYELPALAAEALPNHWKDGEEPAVIYYLPRQPGVGEFRLMRALLDRGKCAVIIGVTGDEESDGPATVLYGRLSDGGIPPQDAMPVKLAADQGALSMVAAPDPTEEVRNVARRIAAMTGDAPFHRVAVIHRQESPYASLLRQELSFAGIPYSGVPRRALADTGAGRFLAGALRLADAMGPGAEAEPIIDRELFIDLVMSCRAQLPPAGNGGRRRRPPQIPATHWANLARSARADGTVRQWADRLRAHAEQDARRKRERAGDDAVGENANPPERPDIDGLVGYLTAFASRLGELRWPGNRGWAPARESLKSLLADFHGRGDGDGDDYDRITEMLDGLEGLANWEAGYSVERLRDAVSEGLGSQVSNRGRAVGVGVYVGPPAGIVGTQYDVVFAVGMVEGQFPPARRTRLVDAWLDDGTAAQTQRALERYEFMGAVAAGRQVVLSYPIATGDRWAAYPSRWALEAANLLYAGAGAAFSRLTSENLTANAGEKPWLTVIPSRETGLRQLAEPADDRTEGGTAPADVADYNLMHLLPLDKTALVLHPAMNGDAHVVRALEAREARWGRSLTRWDGNVGGGFERIAGIGGPDRATSPSALETWANCPYRYFLNRVLGVAAPPEAGDDGRISPLDRGSLVHRILEQFVKSGEGTVDRLAELADSEFAGAERLGITGYPLLWDMEKAAIRDGLRRFVELEAEWLGQPAAESRVEEGFDGVSIDVAGVGSVRFRGKIDRIDVLGNEARVRDFKTGNPGNYMAGARGRQPQYNIANGRALQLPVYVAAARRQFPGFEISASYCFPLEENRNFDPAPYRDEDGLDEFRSTVAIILKAARAGVFPATPEDGEYSNCRRCDYNRLCPTRRRQIWERKGRHDPAAQPYNLLGGKAAIGNDDAAN